MFLYNIRTFCNLNYVNFKSDGMQCFVFSFHTLRTLQFGTISHAFSNACSRAQTQEIQEWNKKYCYYEETTLEHVYPQALSRINTNTHEYIHDFIFVSLSCEAWHFPWFCVIMNNTIVISYYYQENLTAGLTTVQSS